MSSSSYCIFGFNKFERTLKLLSNGLQEKESWDLNTPEKIEAAGKKKEEGNALFKAGKYERASKRYEKVYLQKPKCLNKVICDVMRNELTIAAL